MSTKRRAGDGTHDYRDVINRSAAKSAKGPRLQRLRACRFLIEAIGQEGAIQVYVAVEAEGDVFLATGSSKASEAYSEEDKNLDEETALTFVSPAVINTIVIFVDQWIGWQFSKKIRFGLYTTAAVGKERLAGRAKDLGLVLPEQPIIELLRASDFTDPNLLPCVRALVLDEYASQYADSDADGHYDLIKGWRDGDWTDFFGRITWLFTSEDEAACEGQVIEAIKKCKHYNHSHDGKEDIIVSAVLDLLDKRQLAHDFADRFVHASDLENLFLRTERGDIKRVDPTWKVWEQLQEPVDQRNLAAKLTAVCPTIPKRTLGRYQRQSSAGLIELDAHLQDKRVLAMRYQIYEACEDALLKLAANAATLTEAQLDAELDKLVDAAIARVGERAPDYDYAFDNASFIRNIILTLFDSCFLSFDGGDGGN